MRTKEASVSVLISVVLILVGWSCLPGTYSSETEPVSFGAIPSGSAALIYIADDQSFFTANGLDVTIKDYPTGVATINALLDDDVDIAWAAEFPLVRRAFEKDQISIIASVSRFSDEYLFALKNHGVEKIADLKNKTIGVPKNTIAEFYLARFLELNGLNTEEVTIVDVQPSQSIDAIASGNIDGVVTWEPFTSQIRQQMENKIVGWSVQSSQEGYGIIIARNDWISIHQDIVNRFLKSLAEAEDYLNINPVEAKTIVQERVNYDDAFMETFWAETRFYLSLDQSLITAMEDEARWMISNNLTTEKQIPDFSDFIYVEGLSIVKPESVDLIR
jgi:NitT/TauT family transport system substrate-binding protein